METTTERLVKYIMSYKKYIGEFSMDLYFNDLAEAEECFVVRISRPNGEITHFRRYSFDEALAVALKYIQTLVK